MKNIDRAEARILAADIEAALKVVASKHGLTLTMAGGSFSPADYKPKMTFAVKTDGGVPADFARYAPIFGLKASDYGRSFRSGMKVYTLTAINLKARAYPCVGTDAAGKRFKFSETVVKAMLAA